MAFFFCKKVSSRPLIFGKQQCCYLRQCGVFFDDFHGNIRVQYNEACCIVVNKTDAYLVDRKQVVVFNSPTLRHFPEFHPALPLLVVYARKNKLMESMASVAVNALKLASNAPGAAAAQR